ncbi:hypothetical protein C8J57DRAFT_1463579 [Mycena rebaudengoi]|nr:hypothetical protein C8J57DRAFT_1463579 [Mycena rebaudengoi]
MDGAVEVGRGKRGMGWDWMSTPRKQLAPPRERGVHPAVRGFDQPAWGRRGWGCPQRGHQSGGTSPNSVNSSVITPWWYYGAMTLGGNGGRNLSEVIFGGILALGLFPLCLLHWLGDMRFSEWLGVRENDDSVNLLGVRENDDSVNLLGARGNAGSLNLVRTYTPWLCGAMNVGREWWSSSFGKQVIMGRPS